MITRGGARNRARPTPPKTSPVKSRTSSRPARPNIIRVAVAAKSADQPVSGRRGVGMVAKHNILIVDDQRITQSGLRRLFGSLARYEVGGALDRGATVELGGGSGRERGGPCG